MEKTRDDYKTRKNVKNNVYLKKYSKTRDD